MLHDKTDTGIDIRTDKEVYQAGEDIMFHLKSTDAKEWKHISLVLYAMNESGWCESSRSYVIDDDKYDESFTAIHVNVNQEMLASGENLEKGEFMLVAIMDDGNTKQIGVGEVQQNTVHLMTKFKVE